MTTSDEKILRLLKEFGVAMLVTRAANEELRARPMALAHVDEDGTLWLLTDRHSTKMDEIGQDKHVNVTMQSNTKFVSISGNATAVDDSNKIAELWKETWKVWFPGGKEDPALVLLKVQGRTGEYWDNGGTGGIKYLIEAGRAYLTGTRPDIENDKKIHAKVNLA